MDEFYEYINQENIDKNFICKICEKPLKQPVVTLMNKIICRNCVKYDDNEFTPLTDLSMINILEQLLVRCRLCNENNIKQMNVDKHFLEQCPKAIVECPGYINHCSWLGLREELSEHLSKCSLHNSEYNSQGIFFSINSHVNFQERNISDHDVAIAVKALLINKRLTSVDLFNTKLSSISASIIASVLSNDTHLHILCLRNNFICDSGVQYLAHALIENSYLQHLDLNGNAITDTGARLLSDMLKINRSLVKLTLSFNRITNDGLQYLIESLIDCNSTLQWLCLAGNHGINQSSIKILSNLIQCNQTLQILNLENCQFSFWSKQQIYFLQKIHFKSHLEILL